jgi:hypothetical protein
MQQASIKAKIGFSIVLLPSSSGILNSGIVLRHIPTVEIRTSVMENREMHYRETVEKMIL